MGFFNGLKSAIVFVSGGRTLKKQASFIKEDMSRFKSDLSAVKMKKSSEARNDEWQTFIETHGITTVQLKGQYRARRGVAALLLFALVICLYFIVVRGLISVGWACFIIAGLLYFRNNFRLYQIRHRQLCSIKAFLKQAKTSFKECLPLKLPDDWQEVDIKAGQGE